MVTINGNNIWAYDTGKTPQEIRKRYDDGRLNPDGNYGDFSTHVVSEIHHYRHLVDSSSCGGFYNQPYQVWVNETLGIKYKITMMTGSHFEVLDDKLVPTFQTKSKEDLEKEYGAI